MFRASQHPSSGILKTVTAASGTGHTTGAATLHVSGVTAPIIKLLKTVPAASGTGHTTCTGGCGYSF